MGFGIIECALPVRLIGGTTLSDEELKALWDECIQIIDYRKWEGRMEPVRTRYQEKIIELIGEVFRLREQLEDCRCCVRRLSNELHG
jgi:hypothetical protein